MFATAYCRSSRSIFGKVLLLGVLGLAASSSAKTIMWLGNFFNADPFQQYGAAGLVAVDSVLDPNYQVTNGPNGTYLKAGSFRLTATTAFANPTPTSSAQLKWWAIDNWSPNLFNQSRFRMVMYYQRSNGPMATPPVQSDRVETQEMNGQYGSFPGVIDSCVANVTGDTAWMYFGLNSVASPSTKPLCADHNPYYTSIGTVHFLNPWPGRNAWVSLNGTWYPMYPEAGRPGWVSRTLYAPPGGVGASQLLFANSNPALGGAQYFNSTGFAVSPVSPFPIAAQLTPWERWIAPAMGTGGPNVLTSMPAKLGTLMILNPPWNAFSVRLTWKGVPGRFAAQATPYCNWFAMTLYQGLVPQGIVLNHPLKDSILGAQGKYAQAPADYATFTNWIPLASMVAGMTDTLWLTSTAGIITGRPTTAALMGVCNTKDLAFQAYDYELPGPYFPFSEKTNTDLLKGMVGNTLTATGQLAPAGAICPTSVKMADCTDPANSPDKWFVKNAYNATGCIKQPLTYNPVSQMYEYSNNAYYPLDAWTTAPFNTQKNGLDGKPHNHGFCLHARSTFEYVPGLQFQFTGDDDVWVFIDNKLALDLGGQHGQVSGSINLDKQGLLEGNAYQFDMFYCERHTPGSNISIKTTMNLVPSYQFFLDSAVSGSVKTVNVSMQNTTMDPSKCPDDNVPAIKSSTPGNFFLRYPDGTMQSISNPPQYLGITISADQSQIKVDVDRIKLSMNLRQRGRFAVVVIPQLDVTQSNRAEIPFEIPGGPVDLSGDLYDDNGDGRADRLVVHSPSVTFDGGAAKWAYPVWAKSNGMRDSVFVPAASITTTSDSTFTTTWSVSPFESRTGCPLSGCLNMGRVSTYAAGFPDTVINPIKVLREHLAPYADSARLSYGVRGDPDTLQIWTGEGVRQWSGTTGVSAWAMVGAPNLARPVVVGESNNPTPVRARGGLIQLILPLGHGILATDSVRLAERASDSLDNSSVGSTVWVPLRSRPVAEGWMLDLDGNGAPDRVEMTVRGSLAGADSARVHWKTAAGADTVVRVGNLGGVVSGFGLPGGILGDATYCASGCTVEIRNQGAWSSFPLADSVAAVAIKAVYRYGINGPDTLFVTATEGLGAGSAFGEGYVAGKPTGSNSTLGTLVAGAGTIAGRTIALTMATGVFAADSVRLRGWSLDAFRNAPGARSRWVAVEYGPQPIRVAVFDRNGDGLADSAIFRLTRSAAGAPVPQAFGLRWNGVARTATGLKASADGMSWSGAIGPFPFGTSAWASDSGWLVLPGGDLTSYRGQVSDSVPPVAVNAKLRVGTEPGAADTLLVSGSESLLAANGVLVQLGHDSAATRPVIISRSQIQNSDPRFGGDAIRLVVPAGLIASDVLWVRFGAAISDQNVPVGVSSSWVRLEINASGRGILFDSDGDGRADLMRVVVRGSLTGATTATLNWGNALGAPVSKVWPLVPAIGAFEVKPASNLWFEKGATSCPGICTVVFRDADGGVMATWPLLDSVAPMLVQASYEFGGARDTLHVTFSEKLRSVDPLAVWLEWGRIAVGGVVRHVQATLSVSGTEADLLIDPSVGATEGWDSLRLAAGVRSGALVDQQAVGTGFTSPWAPIRYGLPPLQGALLDPRGEGRGTDIEVHLLRPVPAAAVAAIDHFLFSWPNAAGSGLEQRSVAVGSLQLAGGAWRGRLPEPFALGVTGCPQANCGAVATKPGAQRDMVLLDSVPTSLVRAKYLFSLAEVARDTLVVGLSEPWVGGAQGDSTLAFVLVGTPAAPQALQPWFYWALSPDKRELRMVVDTIWATRIGVHDQVRLIQGSRVLDPSGNVVGELSRWVPIEFGLRPPQLDILPWPDGILTNSAKATAKTGVLAWEAPPLGTPAIELLVRDPYSKADSSHSNVKLAQWKRVEGVQAGNLASGGEPVNPVNHLLGVKIRLNRPFQGKLIIYDNMGTSVRQVDLDPLRNLWTSANPDAERDVWIAWNGTGPNGKFAASGVYLFRAVVRVGDGQGGFVYRNLLWKLGWHRDVK